MESRTGSTQTVQDTNPALVREGFQKGLGFGQREGLGQSQWVAFQAEFLLEQITIIIMADMY